jgi:hypothetical protein
VLLSLRLCKRQQLRLELGEHLLRGYKQFCVRGVAGGEKEEMRISRKKFAVVGAVGAVENGGGTPFSTTPQPSIDRPSSVELQTNRATRSLRSPGGAERSY